MNISFVSDRASCRRFCRPPLEKPGFSLIMTVSILVLLALVAVGLLTLSTLTIRSGALSSAQAEAQANARLALMLAIGELQKHAGADQRVTANAAILDDSPDSPEVDGVDHPHWTGVWNAWAAGDESYGTDGESHHRTIAPRGDDGMAPSYEENREDHFRSWLVSLNDGESGEIDSARSLSLTAVPLPGTNGQAIRMVGRGSLGDDAGNRKFVAAGLRDLDTDARTATDRNGRYAWWVADESTKARVLGDSFELGETVTKADLLDRALSAGSTGHDVIPALEELNEPELVQRAFTRGSMEVPASDRQPVRGTFHEVTPYSFGVMADVREGGLKRDLNSLLERPISMDEDGDEFMLYRFGRDDDRVPVQDLAAYYQCYREVIDYTGRQARNPLGRNTMQVNNINFGPGFNFTRDYTNIYRMPLPVKVQFLMSYIGEPRRPTRENRDRYKLHIGVTPSLTLWNPYNVPLVLNQGGDNSTQMRLFNIPFGISWTKTGARGTFTSPEPNSLVWITNRNQTDFRNGSTRNSDRDNGITLYVGGNRNQIVFQPGEVRVFSLRRTQSGNGYSGILNRNTYTPDREADPGWDPTFFLKLPRSEQASNRLHVDLEYPNNPDPRLKDGGSLTFNPSDQISISITPASSLDVANGAALHFFHRQSTTMGGGVDRGIDRGHMRRQFQFTSRLHTESQKGSAGLEFNRTLMEQALPDGLKTIEMPAISGSEIIGSYRPFLLVSLTAGCEISQNVAGDFRGRRFVSRPFLHSTPVQTSVFVDRNDSDSFYHHGWNWWVQDVNSVLEASVQVAANNRSGFWGGGYTPEFGAQNIVQQEVPVTPVHSIGSLSHATLSGYSLSDKILGFGAGRRFSRDVGDYTDNPFANTTATGGNGLFPRTSQAIGNSYAHPYLAPDEAFGTWTRHYNATDGPKEEPFVDHSYLANKAIWDDYFFSSIAPRETKIFTDEGSAADARKVAEQFFFEGEKLPNRRFVPYRAGLSEDVLDRFFEGGVANLEAVEEIAAHLMVEGPFNVNSTSVEAWRALFSSLRDREVAVVETNNNTNQLGRGVPIERETPDGVPVSATSLGNGEPFTGSRRNPSEPRQWHSWRQLTDGEIRQLSIAMVAQVKKRGPFLSLSDFVNRRLDRRDRDLSLKGALQSALDDDDVDINAGFRDADRQFASNELGGMNPEFREALEGPIAYGSAAYVDQADILRGFGGQLTPRGDTFLIRTYGDSVDSDGQIKARAWCEAVVQRVPEYLDQTKDKPSTSFDELDSESNRQFGRPFRVVSFRWLDADEV